jgi:hypothetical protein
LIIVGVVGALLVMCCCAGGGLIAILSVGPDTSSTTGSAVDELTGLLPDSDDDERVQEWLDWSPDSPVMLPEPSSEKQDLIVQALRIAAPQLSMDSAVTWQGYYDEAEDWYYGDAFYVRATHPSSSRVSAAVELWIQSDQMVSEDISFEPADEDYVTTIAGGSREILYRTQWGAEGFTLGEDEDALWERIGLDWPDAVVVEGQPSDGGSNRFVVELTKWSVYAVDADYPLVSATYENIDGDWTLVEWEYLYPDETAGVPST